MGHWVVAHQLLHVPPAVGAAPHDVDQALVGHYSHTEPGLLHRTLHPPLVQTWIIFKIFSIFALSVTNRPNPVFEQIIETILMNLIYLRKLWNIIDNKM